MQKTVAIFCLTIGVGLFIFFVFLIYQRTLPANLAFAFNKEKTNTYSTSKSPNELIIPDLKIDLPIERVQFKGNAWPVSLNGVSYLGSTPVPGEIGNSVLYGHNWINRLGNLVNIRPGQRYYIRFSDSTMRSFVVKYTAIVSPDETHILDNSSDARVTLYTCSGIFDTKRFVAVAIPETL